MLEAEGVSFNERGRCELQQFLFIPKEPVDKQKAQAKKLTLFKT
jgi:hypothetical protein